MSKRYGYIISFIIALVLMAKPNILYWGKSITFMDIYLRVAFIITVLILLPNMFSKNNVE